MALLKPIETLESRLSNIPIEPGQMIFCADSRNIYIDNHKNSRIHMTDIIRLNAESDRASLQNPVAGKMYLVEENNVLYKYNGSQWETISGGISINTNSVPVSNLISCTLQQNNIFYGPRTLASSVYMDDGKTVKEVIAELKTNSSLTSLKNTVVIEQSTDTVNIGIDGYNKNRDILFVYKNSVYIEEEQDYTIVDNTSIRKKSGTWDATYGTTFNFVVVTPTAKISTLNQIEQESYIDKIVELTEKVDRYESTISLLTDKISLLEEKIENFYK